MRRVIDELSDHPLHYGLPLLGVVVLSLALIALRPSAPAAVVAAPAPAPAAAQPTAEPLSAADQAWLAREQRVADHQDREAAKRTVARRRAAHIHRRQDAGHRSSPNPAPASARRPAVPSGDDAPAAVVSVQRHLTVGEVRKAHEGGLAMQERCIAMIKEDWERTEQLTDAAVAGEFALIDALKTDPDTQYRWPNGASSSMRESALTVIDTLSAPDCDHNAAQDLARAINGLPR